MQEPSSTVAQVSVVIPVFNVENYLAECLASVQQQDYPDWEAVIVIDGSTDRSETIARRFAAEDNRFTVLTVPNGGLGSARNIGLDHSTGDYVFWLDSDDTLPPGTLSALMAQVVETGAEIVAGFAEDFGAAEIPTRYWTQTGDLYRGGIALTSAERDPDVLHDHVVWNKLYRRELLQRTGARFPAGVHCEDMAFSARVQLEARLIAVVPRLVYRHRRHDQAISASYIRDKTLGDWIQQSERTLDVILELGSDEVLQNYLGRFLSTQWWTRARSVGQFESRDHLPALDALTQRLSHLFGPARLTKLPILTATVLTWMSANGAESLIRTIESAPPLFEDSFGRSRDEARRAADIARDLANDDRPFSRDLARAIALSRCMQPVADGYDSMDFADLVGLCQHLARGGAASTSVPTQAERSFPRTANQVMAFLEGRGRGNARVASLRRGPSDLTIRGTGRAPLGASSAEAANLDLHGPTGVLLRSFPLQWKCDADSSDFRFQCRIPVDLAPKDEPLTASIYFHRDGVPKGSAGLEPDSGLPLEVHGPGKTLLFPPSLLAPQKSQRRVFSIPAWRDNPFTTMLQMELVAEGFVLAGSSRLDEITAELHDRHRSGPVHIHWPNAIIDDALSIAQANSRVDAFLEALQVARARGRPIVWTVHNAMPHDLLFRAAATRLHQGIADLVDVVHIMNSQTVEAVAADYTLPQDKVVHIPHSSYAGVYGPSLDPVEARQAIGAPKHSRTILLFGQLRAYKGLDVLAEAFERAEKRDPRLHLLVAGRPTGDVRIEEHTLLAGPRATLAARFIEDSEVSSWLSAADVMVLPYRRVLNSGALHLAATFGVPVIMPRDEFLQRDLVDEAWVRFFDPENSAETLADLLADEWYLQRGTRDAASRFARRLSPSSMSRSYMELIRSLTV